MVIEQISREDLLKMSRASVGLSRAAEQIIDDALLAALLRRTAGILCPCSVSTLISSVLDGLQYLVDDKDAIADQLIACAEGLIVTGDLLELNQVTTDDPDVKGTWVFMAPPSFVVRPDGTIHLIGIVPDEIVPLPAAFRSRIVHQGTARLLTPEPSEDLKSALRDLGWLELSNSTWLKSPKPTSAADLREAMLRRLEEQPASGPITDLSILDPASDVRYYASRWVAPTDHVGHFVARRPQAYGAPLWGYASLMNGNVTKFLDLPLKGTRWRGCDIAWHLQMAIDNGRNTPQFYRCRAASDGALFDFFSPLPLWAGRRLEVLGRPAPAQKCLFTYWIPQREVESEEEFLRERLWLARREA